MFGSAMLIIWIYAFLGSKMKPFNSLGVSYSSGESL
jgi:hypothetical protein